MDKGDKMKLINSNELFNFLEKLDPVIKDKGRIPQIDKKYTEFIHQFKEVSITPDIVLYGYRKAIEWNKRASDNNLPQNLWLIGQSGQGDEWFLNEQTKTVFFFDHNQGEYGGLENFLNLQIDFTGFLRMGFLLAKLEQRLEKDQSIDEFKQVVMGLMNSIHPQLFEMFPYKYFD
ncbi:Uncharacterised protein [Weeksella virosa]|uniref:SMI1/KNR4 family protein n=2 Tax=Weeksella virosa TaxID=1014 RepID=F0P316_WEEVC|nr:hypothetical protein [Weeksella virosa]ADX67928.1 hypothetical protein Weevi_1222 [Weeksella virosa DSM 16922]VEH64441.1 Uncharacterised protein [Weeksella virosa]